MEIDNQIDFSIEHWVVLKIVEIRQLIISQLEIQLKSSDPKIEIYFKRAFTRWIFNAVRHGINPFKGGLTVKKFICDDDIDYFFETNEKFTRRDIDWTFLDYAFKNIDIERKTIKTTPRSTSRNSSHENITYSRGGLTYQLTRKQWDQARKRSSLEGQLMNDTICILVARYTAAGTKNNHSSAPPEVIRYSGAQTELFGSPFNTCLDQYCSAFPDFERYFGSMGSFFDFVLETGIYFMNPPFDDEIMMAAVEKIIEALHTSCEITVIMVIPMWDVESQAQLKGRIHVDREYKTLNVINKSGFVKSRAVLNIREHKFYNYYYDEYLAVADAHMIVLSNTEYNFTARELANFWAVSV